VDCQIPCYGLFAYEAGISRDWEIPANVIGGAADHHLAMFALSKNHPLKKKANVLGRTSGTAFSTIGIELDERFLGINCRGHALSGLRRFDG
jgi:hypothetical protein